MSMRNYKFAKTCSVILGITFLLAFFLTGCGRDENPTPVLTGINPSTGTQGKTVAVTLTGTNFISGTTISVSGTGINVNSPSVVSSTSITANFVIASDAALGGHDVTVSNGAKTSPSSVKFTVAAPPPPTLTSISPASGTQGRAVTVTLTGTNFAPGATVGISSLGVTASNVTFVNASQMTVVLTVDPTAAPGSRNVTVSQAGVTTAAQPFNVTALQPAAIASVPLNGATGVPINSRIIVKFNKPMDPTTAINSLVVKQNGVAMAPLFTPTYSPNNRAVIWTPVTNFANAATITVQIIGALDSGGAPLVQGTLPNPFTFTVGSTADNTPPTVTISPADGTTGVARNTRIIATFTKDMDCSTLFNDGSTPSFPPTFTVTKDGTTTPIAGPVYCLGNVASFVPAANLEANTKYNVQILGVTTSGARDLQSNNLAATFNSSFTTGNAAPDTTAPTVVPTPANGATGVAVSVKPTTTFSKAMDPATIHGGTFLLTGPGNTGTVVTGTVTYDVAGKKATFNPTTNLAAGSTYTATIVGGSNGVRDTTGNPLPADFIWTFTTAP